MNRMLLMRKFRYGAISIGFTAIFIAIVIIANTLFSGLAYKLGWYVDMSSDEVYTLGESSKALLADVEGDVNIIFCMDPDELDEIQMMRYVHSTAKQLENEFDNIEVEYKDPKRNPSAFTKYKSSSGTTISPYHVIVESGTEHRLIYIEAFFKRSTNDNRLFAYDGEFKFTSTILALTQTESPIACVTIGHGEPFPTSDIGIFSLLVEAGYTIMPIDLETDDIPEECRLLIINDPISDFKTPFNGSSVSEIKKIDEFLDEDKDENGEKSNGGSLMVFMDYETKELPMLEEFLHEWGIKFERELLSDLSSSLSGEQYSLFATYAQEETQGASIHEDLRAAYQYPPKPIVKNTMHIVSTYDENGNYNSNGIERNISTVLYSSENAEAVKDGKTVSSAKDVGPYNLMTFTVQMDLHENDPYYSYVLACATPEFAEDMSISGSYANRDILYSALRAMGREKLPTNIDFKILYDTTLPISSAQANFWTVALVGILPIVVAVTGIIVVIRRKHS